jgi:membrane-associated phospholipid phosphatase
MGYWDGTVPPPEGVPASDYVRALRLQPDARLAVFVHEGMRILDVRPAAPAHVVRAGSAPEAGDLVALTPPGGPAIAAQMVELRAAMDLRADRMVEILAQQGDMLSFFGAQLPLSAQRRPATALLLAVVYEVVAAQEMRIKHLCSVPRPVDLSPRIQPVIQTPGHSAYPSGHATEAHAFATVLAALHLAARPGPAPAAGTSVLDAVLAHLTPAHEAAAELDPVILLFRLAARIADNRTVAGVHYPVDSAHGALLGLGTTLALVAHCLGGGAAVAVPTWAAAGDDWAGDYTLRKWVEHLGAAPGTGWRRAPLHLPAAEPWRLLPALWADAVAEWSPQDDGQAPALA